MTTDTPFDGTPIPPPPPIATSERRGWAGSDLAIGSSLIVLLIALFLPWFTASLHLRVTPVVNATGSGTRAHAYLWFVFAFAIVALAALVARDAIARIPGNLPSAEQILVGATGVCLILTILGVAFRPAIDTGSVASAAIQPLLGRLQVSVSVGWSYGGFVALVAAAVAFIGAVGIPGHLSARRQRLSSGPAWRLPRTGG